MDIALPGAKTLIQCDFDGTITDRDVSLALLERFASPDWKKLLDEYRKGTIAVDEFISRSFATVRAPKNVLTHAALESAEIRPGFKRFVAFCGRRGFRLVVVSNGLDFYIEAFLEAHGVDRVEVRAGRTVFSPRGLKISYFGPDGKPLRGDHKLLHLFDFLAQGYRLVYVGNGDSDIPAFEYADRAFATGALLRACRSRDVDCIPFADFNDIVLRLKS
jgi:2-hydroxy-3-keto-5-methylthiopentenyl-1-phosphate phosphatase